MSTAFSVERSGAEIVKAAGGWIQSLFTSATAFFSLFALPLTGQFGWTSSQFSMAYTIYMFVYCAMGFVGGLLAEKLQPRVAIYIGLVFFAAGWFLTGFASSIPQLYLFYGVMAGAGAGTIYPACLPTALKWFPDKAGYIGSALLAAAAVALVFAARKLAAKMQETN